VVVVLRNAKNRSGVCSDSRADARVPGSGRRDPAARTFAVANDRETVAYFNVPFAPAEIRVDPDGRLLLKVTAISRR